MQQPRVNRRLLIGGAVFLVLTCLIFFTTRERARQSLPERLTHGAFAPLQKLVTGVADFAGGTVKTIGELGRLHKDNEALRRQVASIEAEKDELLFYRRENIRLRAALSYQERRPLDLIPAEVIGYNPGNWLKSLTIDKGSKDGLRSDMPVISRRGLIGRLRAVRPGSADVLIVSDPRAPVAGVVERTREQVRVMGRPDGLCTVTPYGRGVKLRVGDRVVTWKGSEYFPDGLVIGRIIEVERDSFGVSSQGIMQLSVDMSRLEDVYVIRQVKGRPDGQEGE